ncbi:helix-turn-helix domain-containing protein [Myroides marinus]|uniref:AraC-type DNA-binding protein n=1 Tax=Myroides marinus TaxID=703342 RepID=A0A1H6T769_9FLAO|nr:helix-turn-helix transcriptional regulator [Myroides marinus]MDM1378993.1 helix-turn-helix domain-containing protein [Myroides marinus]MDM1386264.1 helix-turn-helix domain-containing protein [Myroides marinus]MDM1393477.1 helix-turn-helix domain-containing protein [Myroides marinus]SEI75933.1 AraC-type DNA-binding protein [Myroides marinus]
MEEITILQMRDLTDEVKGADFYANTIPQHLITNHNHVEKPHRHDFYVCMIFTQGSGTHEIDFHSYEIKPGAIFVLAPGQTHSWVLSDDIDGYIFFHTQEFFDLYFVRETIREYPVFRSSYYPNGLIIEGQDKLILESVFKRIAEEVDGNRWKKNTVLVNLASLLYIEFNRLILAGDSFIAVSNLQYNNHLQHFEDLLEKNFQTEKSAAVYAEWMNMTQKHLNRVCKTLVDKTTTDIIIDRVILEAKRMLIYTGKSFNEIGSMLGYDDYSYFSKVFKKKVGYTPKEFLKKYN